MCLESLYRNKYAKGFCEYGDETQVSIKVDNRLGDEKK
jgi:hypothetical protein